MVEEVYIVPLLHLAIVSLNDHLAFVLLWL